MSFFSLLSLASSGLSAHRSASQTASHNLANASTPGYARQRANLEAMDAQRFGDAYLGRGVGLMGVSQARDRFLEAQLPSAFGNAGRSEAEAMVLTSISQLSPGLPDGVPASLGAFYGSMRELSENPGSEGHRAAFVQEARQLALSFQRAAADLDQARRGVDASLEDSLPEVNDLARQVASLNRQIRAARAQGGEPNDLLDARQRAVDSLAQLTGARPIPDSDGNISLALPSGTAIVSQDNAAVLDTIPDPANGGHLALRITPTDGTTPRLLVQGDIGGALGGAIDARDGSLLQAEQDLDNLAFELATTLNGIHQGGFALDGTTGRDLFVVTGPAGAASSLEVEPTVLADPSLVGASATAATVPGDNAQLLAMLGTETTALATGAPPAQTMADLIARFGSSAKSAISSSEADGLARDHLTGLRDSVSGVSVDEELVEMTKAQRAFEALSKVVTTTDQMLETVLKLR